MTRLVSRRPRATRIGAALLGCAMALASMSVAVLSEGAKDGPPSATSSLKDGADNICKAFGPDYTAVGDSGLCARMGGGILVYSGKEFTDHDVVMLGQRIPTLFNAGAGAPIVYYHKDDVSKQTKNPSAGVYAFAQMMLQAQNEDMGLLRGFIRIAADARTHYTHDGGMVFDLRKIENSYYYGALDEAWVQWNGFKLGIQPSMFGFNRLPSVVTPGYTSIVTTLAASYTVGLSRNASISIAMEDPTRRLMGDGILARPGRGDIPDIVAMARIATPSTLYHISGAIRHADDHVMKDFIGGDEKSVWGWAWSAGLQHRVKWEDLIGQGAQGVYGRFGLTFAQASGALGYLGVPFFAPDYIAAGDGRIFNSTGWSGLVSYEHMLAPRVKLNLNASFFNVSMHSRGEPVIPAIDMPVAPDLAFEVDVRGTVLQAGLEFIPMPNMVLGVEGGYTTTEAKGRYVGVSGEKASAGFPHVGVYLRKSF
ncbi:MAG: porin [Hyphomicrobium sp.]|nr:porin [Hyphomicrobium sp.]